MEHHQWRGKNVFVKRFLDVVQSEDVLVSHCIIHQENLCSKVLNIGKIIKNIISCVNYIRSGDYRKTSN